MAYAAHVSDSGSDIKYVLCRRDAQTNQHYGRHRQHQSGRGGRVWTVVSDGAGARMTPQLSRGSSETHTKEMLSWPAVASEAIYYVVRSTVAWFINHSRTLVLALH
jgi:hypothetical protein